MKARALILIIIMFPLIGFDQFTKSLAIAQLMGESAIVYLNGFFSLTYHENTGAFLSLGADLPKATRTLIFSILIGVILLGLFIYLCIKPTTKPELLAWACILAGGVGNHYDRITNDGAVVDFLLLQVGPLRTGVFNFADVYIMAGVGLLIFFSTRVGESLCQQIKWLR